MVPLKLIVDNAVGYEHKSTHIPLVFAIYVFDKLKATHYIYVVTNFKHPLEKSHKIPF